MIDMRIHFGAALLFALVCGCELSAGPRTPSDGVTPKLLGQGVAAGEVTSHSALIWMRTDQAATVQLEWQENNQSNRSTVVDTVKTKDYTATVLLDELKPETTYRYRVMGQGGRTDRASESAEGRFVTAPPENKHAPVTFVWSGDLGGQQHCRRAPSGYAIFDQILRQHPSFMIFLGDTIYGDDRCTVPPNVPGSEFTASLLDEYRAKHRYQREDSALQRFLAATPVYAIWDDHEVRNNFSGTIDPQMPIGRQALLEYWPIATPPTDPFRLYRNFRWGADAEIFILDTRQYRSSNGHPDGPNKTMLGSAQREWLIEGLTRSTATWKFVVTSVPLSNQKGGTLLVPGNDSWARGADGTGFLTELSRIVTTLQSRHVRNIVWLAGDVHYAQVNDFDPDGDGITDFYEFISGPLSAAFGRPVPPNRDLRPNNVYSEGGFANFGKITVDGPNLHLAIIDDTGLPRFERTIQAQGIDRP